MRRAVVLFLLVVGLSGGTLVVRQRAVQLAAKARASLRVNNSYEFQAEDLAQEGDKLVAVEVQAEPSEGAPSAVRFEDLRLLSPDGRQEYTLQGVSTLGPAATLSPPQAQRPPLPEKALVQFRVPASFHEGKLHYWGAEVGSVRLQR